MENLIVFYPEGHEAHVEFGHPERPERVEAIKEALRTIGIWNQASHAEASDIPDEVLYSVHSPDYIVHLKEVCQRGGRLDMDTFTTSSSWELAIQAAGGAIQVAESVWSRASKRGFALTRPPGHHATKDRGMGFCLLNNIAIAAEYLIKIAGAERLAIVDFDLHHGNGTQDIFWYRGDIFYFSTHQYPHYPGSGRVSEIGEGDGEGKNANFPMPAMSGDLAYRSVLGNFFLPLLEKYNPEMILVSYGYDTHWRDPLGNILLSADGYRHLISCLVDYVDEYCDGRIALFLEGGYDLEAAKACSTGVVSALMKQDWNDPLGPAPRTENDSYKKTMEEVMDIWGLNP